jgi:hypothetical protein
LFAAAACALALLAIGAPTAGAAIGDVETPTVFGPEPSTPTSHPFLATDIDLASYGYVEEEFEFAGDAFGYNTPALATGSKITTGGVGNDGKFPYRTRMVVRRPANAADFNGVVVAEWYNVTAQYDLEANWFGDPEYLLKNGYAFVGISAQRVGVNHLKGWDPARYGDLDVTAGGTVTPNDALSYEIFSAGVKAIRGAGNGVDPLGPLADPNLVIASGESQSGSRLATYYNSIQPLHEVVDAFLLTVSTNELRDDRPEKVIRVLSETENRTQRVEADNDSYRHWEVAAGSHVPRMAYDNWNGPVDRDTGGQDVECEKFPLSYVQWPFVVNSAIDHLVTWSDGGAAPPTAPRGVYVNPTTLARNSLGIAEGGIRLPQVTVPVALNTGSNAASPTGPPLSLFCILLGSYEIFPQEQLDATYADYGAYVDQVIPAAQAVADQGFILAEDVPRLIQQHEEFPQLRPTVPTLTAGEAINRTGLFTLAWRGTEAPDTTFELQGSKDGGQTWTTQNAGATPGAPEFAFAGEGQSDGDWVYRVRSSTVIPANVVADAYTVTTPWSATSANVLTDGTGPKLKLKCPKEVERGSRAFAKVKAKDKLSGLKGKPPRKVKIKTAKAGTTKVKVKAKDKLGNKSKESCKVRVVR